MEGGSDKCPPKGNGNPKGVGGMLPQKILNLPQTGDFQHFKG